MSEQVPEQAQGNGEAQAPETPDVGDVVARGAAYYRNARFILAAALMLYGIWSIHDGFYSWPAMNAKEVARDKILGLDPKPPHSDMDVLFNKVLGCALPPLAGLLIFWTMYNSRGEVRLEGQTLSVPGHPPIPLPSVESIDKQRWERKGIALVSYRLDTGKVGNFKLDDFVYEREGISRIFKRIEKALLEPHAPKIAPIAAAPRVATPPRPVRMPPRPRPGG